jgi:hypothetical protein
MNENLVDNCFYVKYKKYGTWCSYDKEGNSLVTSLTEEQCIRSTRWIFQFHQESKLNSVEVTLESKEN